MFGLVILLGPVCQLIPTAIVLCLVALVLILVRFRGRARMLGSAIALLSLIVMLAISPHPAGPWDPCGGCYSAWGHGWLCCILEGCCG